MQPLAGILDTLESFYGLIETQLPATPEARRRAYLLLQRHARELCKAGKPKCGECPVSGGCRYFASVARQPL